MVYNSEIHLKKHLKANHSEELKSAAPQSRRKIIQKKRHRERLRSSTDTESDEEQYQPKIVYEAQSNPAEEVSQSEEVPKTVLTRQGR
mmetsp:Transcript_31559/g.37041  ORF Transcript_31559/g.37041 Transcript_31559/m.37041 type:complete len:88 (-) Transcript_31559:695-958(-)